MAHNRGRKRATASGFSLSRWLPVVIELPPFTRKWEDYRLTEADRTALLHAILNDPEASPVLRGMAGARKARFSSHELDRGKSSGYRVFYAVFRKYGKVVLVTLFPKNTQANLSRAAQNLVAQLLREIEAEMERIDQEERAKAPKRRR
jgi:hypothetical protein